MFFNQVWKFVLSHIYIYIYVTFSKLLHISRDNLPKLMRSPSWLVGFTVTFDIVFLPWGDGSIAPLESWRICGPVCANGMTDLLDKCPVKETFLPDKQVLLDAQPVL